VYQLSIANLQGTGARDYQQDAFWISNAAPNQLAADGLQLLLADGMGGVQDGALIAQYTLEQLTAQIGGEPANILGTIAAINAKVEAQYHERGGTTLLVAQLDAQARLWFASVGDSNIYLWRNNLLVELTRRHEYLLDLLERVLEGSLELDDALANPQAKALASFIGVRQLSIDHSRTPLPLQAGDSLLLCSDGISDSLSQEQLAATLALPAQAAVEQLEALIRIENIAKQDNYTAIVVNISTATTTTTTREGNNDE